MERDSADVHIDGMGAELAACRVLNLYPDLTTVKESQKKPIHDARWGFDTLDIKHTTHTNGGIAVVKSKVKEGKRCRCYVLVTGTMPDYCVVGWAYGDDVFQEKNIQQNWKVPGYLLKQEKLHQFHILSVATEFQNNVD